METKARLKAIEETLAEMQIEIKNPENVLNAIKKIENTVQEFNKTILELKKENTVQHKEILFLKSENKQVRSQITELREIIEASERDKRK